MNIDIVKYIGNSKVINELIFDVKCSVLQHHIIIRVFLNENLKYCQYTI